MAFEVLSGERGLRMMLEIFLGGEIHVLNTANSF